jgi:hypothetical protein
VILIHPIPLLLLLIIGLLTALIFWGFWQAQSQKSDGTWSDFGAGNLQLWFLALAIFTLGVLVTYVLFIFLLR